MKTRNWLLLIGLILSLCLVLSVVLLNPGANARYAEVYSDGRLLYRLDLRQEQQVTVVTDRGTNVITVQNGAVAVTQADCPDGYCIKRGFCSAGAQIVCLPHRLVIRFVGENHYDGVSGQIRPQGVDGKLVA